MGILDWWIDRTVEHEIERVFAEKLPAMIDAEIERQCKARGIKLVPKSTNNRLEKG